MESHKTVIHLPLLCRYGYLIELNAFFSKVLYIDDNGFEAIVYVENSDFEIVEEEELFTYERE